MNIITIRDLYHMMPKLNKYVPNSYILVNASRRKIIAKLTLDIPPKELEVIKKQLFKR